jgi:TetR/AcrR family transcriptional regulator, repressor for uid operon
VLLHFRPADNSRYHAVVTEVPLPPPQAEDPLRDRLLVAAAEVFAERGYERAGVAEIARRAGLTTGAIYTRYAGKAELLLDAIDARTHDEIRRLLGGDRSPERGTAVLATLGSHLVEPGADAGHALVFEAFVAARRDPDVAAMLRRRIEDQDARLAKLVEEGKADGTIDPALSTDAVVLFSHAVGFGFLLYGVVERDLPSRHDWQQVIARVVAGAAPAAESEVGDE